jgi:REP element-mobilizing transposase RayT
VAHRRRAAHDSHCPAHVTLRAHADVPSFRGDRLSKVLKCALGAANRAGFRVLHFSLQRDHVHLLVEADCSLRFCRGMQGLAVRLAKAANRCLGRRGRVWDSRYHSRVGWRRDGAIAIAEGPYRSVRVSHRSARVCRATLPSA